MWQPFYLEAAREGATEPPRTSWAQLGYELGPPDGRRGRQAAGGPVCVEAVTSWPGSAGDVGGGNVWNVEDARRSAPAVGEAADDEAAGEDLGAHSDAGQGFEPEGAVFVGI